MNRHEQVTYELIVRANIMKRRAPLIVLPILLQSQLLSSNLTFVKSHCLFIGGVVLQYGFSTRRYTLRVYQIISIDILLGVETVDK